MSTPKDLATLFRRDLAKLIQHLESFPDDESLWQVLPGVSNAAGNLALHIEGNLREFVGHQLGQLSYVRNRSLEFSARGLSRREICAQLTELKDTIPMVIENLSEEQLEMEYPEVVLVTATSTREFLIHLYGHLNWHLGQVNYLRRILIP
jgi:hypothetical protein